jgi:REP element-mobilizing transposase RayT
MDTDKGPRKLCTRLNVPGDIHELTFTCYKRRPFLSKDRTRAYLVDAINSARVKHDFYLLAYVFMPEHAHLLIYPRREEYDMSKILQSIKQPVAQRAIKYLRKENPAGLTMLQTGAKARAVSILARRRGTRQEYARRKRLGERNQVHSREPRSKGTRNDPRRLALVERSRLDRWRARSNSD